MQVFSTFFKVSKKYIGLCTIYLGMFIPLILIFSSQGKKSDMRQYQGAKCDIAIFDRDNTEASAMLTSFLASRNDIVSLNDERAELLDNLFYENVDYVLYIEEGFEKTGKLSNIKRPGTGDGSYVDSSIASYTSSMDALCNAGYSLEEANEITLEALDASNLVTVEIKGNEKTTSYYFFQYLPYVITMMLFSVLVPILLSFNKREMLDRTSISPVKSRERSLQIIAGEIVFGLLIWAFFMILALIMYRGDLFKGKIMLSMLNSLLFVVVIIGLVSIFGSLNIKANNISMISNIVGLGMSFLGGIFVPLEIFSKQLLVVSKFMPTYWFITAQDHIFSNDSLSDIFKCFGIMSLFAVVFVAIAMIVSRKMRVRSE